jgi:hypothetical protein
MAGCSLFASGLPAQVSGQPPIFEFTQPYSDNYFGVQLTYLQNAATCYGTNSIPRFTPVIQNTDAKYTRTCDFLTTPSYTGLFCTKAPVSEIPDGTLTISFKGYTGAAHTAPIPFKAVFGRSPAPKTESNDVVKTTTTTKVDYVAGKHQYTSTVTGKYPSHALYWPITM